MTKTTNRSGVNAYRICIITMIFSLLVLGGWLLQQNQTGGIAVGTDEIATLSRSSAFSGRPLRFIANEGQAGARARFHVQGAGHTVLFHENKIVLRRTGRQTARNEIVLQFLGANQSPAVEGVEQLPGVAHFYKGRNPDEWHIDVPTYKSVVYEKLYPGIDMAWIGDDGLLESEFYISPGADYHQIRLDYEGIESKTIRDDGALVIETELGELVEKTPFAYQDIDGSRTEVEAEYILLADASVGFKLGQYDQNLPLVIDPELIFLTTIVGQVGGSEFGTGVVIDSAGNVILCGAANRFFPAMDVIDSSNHAGGVAEDGLLVKLDGTTGAVIYSALFGGTQLDYFSDIAIDSFETLYLTGLTASSDFPVLNSFQDTLAGLDDAFLVTLNAAGQLTRSTYLGGSKKDWGGRIALDGAGNIYIGGRTESTDFPITGGFQTTFQGGSSSSPFPSDNFVAKVSAAGSVVYSTYLGGSDNDIFIGIAVNDAGEATVTGTTMSNDFPMMNAYQATYGGGAPGEGDIYITRLNTGGNGLVYSSYFGGAAADFATGMALTSDGHTLVAGGTTSLDFPVVNGQSFPETNTVDGILIKLDNTGQPGYSLRTNRPGFDRFSGVVVDDSARALVVGTWADTARIYHTYRDSALIVNFKTAAPGRNVADLYLANGLLASATTYFPPLAASPGQDRNMRYATNSSSGSQAGALFWDIVTQPNVTPIWNLFLGSTLGLEDYVFGDENLNFGVNQNGNMTVNGEIIGPKSDDVEIIDITGSERDEFIDLRDVTDVDFASLTNVSIATGGGADVIWGSYAKFINQLVNSGAGPDQIYIALWFFELNAIFNGGTGDDAYLFVSGPSPIQPSALFLNSGSAANLPNPVTIVDSGGVDTLNFLGHGAAITLDLKLLNSAQTIDTAGAQITLDGIFEVVICGGFDDVIKVSPLPGSTRHVNGGAGNDTLYYESVGAANDDGSTISTAGLADVTYANIETVILSISTGIDDPSATRPVAFSLSQNFPNPFNPSTSIRYSLSRASYVTLDVYNSIGQKVSTLVDTHQNAGRYDVTFNATDFSSGLYFYSIRTDEDISVRKMLLLK